MKVVLTAAQMKLADRMTIEEFGIPGFTLMEVAGRSAADRVAEYFHGIDGARICCLCGRGNNAGDALVAARHLCENGAGVAVRMVLGVENLTQDARTNLDLIEQLGVSGNRDVTVDTGVPEDFHKYDIVVDGLLGIGLESTLREPLLGVIEALNSAQRSVVALDIPTGIHADNGQVMGAAVIAQLTVTMGAGKPGLFLGEGPDYSGQIEVADIGIPRFILQKASASPPGPIHMPTPEDIIQRLPHRSRRAHKYSAGVALVIAGSPGLTGAAVMASTAAARTGAGAVVCGTPESVHTILSSRLTEVMTVPLAAGEDGISPDAAIAALSERLERANALLVGPGLGRAAGTGKFVRQLLRLADQPAVVDADALFHLAEDRGAIAARSEGKWVLTPHLGELQRLVGDEIDASNAVETARTLAKQWNSVLVFKGAPTVVATPEGRTYISPAGNQALATAGAGDVLAGMIAGFLAQGLTPLDAALCALFVGGMAVENLARERNRDSIMATDIVSEVPSTLKRFTD